VSRISDQLATDLEQGMMTMGEATFAAANGMAAGVKEGKELTRYIQMMDSAVVAGTGSFDEMNQIFGQTADLGHLTANNFDMMTQRLPGFSAAMQDHMGVSADALRDMLNDGEVSLDDFLSVIESDYGGMAEEYSKTWEGMVANTKNWVGIIGQEMLSGVFEQSKDSLNEFIEFLKSPEVMAFASRASEALGSAFSKILAGVQSVIEWFMNLPAPVQKAGLAFGAVAVAAGPVLLIIGNIVAAVGTAITAFGTIMGVLSKIPAPLNILGGLFRMVSPLLSILGKGVMLVTGALRALWLTMLANPIVLIIAAVAAVVAALIWFFTQTETGKEIWANFMEWLGNAWQWIKDTAVTVFNAVVGAIVGAWEWIRDKTSEIWNTVVTWIQDNWDKITGILSLANPVTAVIRHWDTIKEATGTAWQWVQDTISNAWNTVKRTVLGALNRVKNTINRGWNSAKNLTTNAWTAMRNAVSNGITGVVNFVRGLPGRILSALGNLGSMLYNSGWSMIDGLRQGIVNGFNNAVSAVRNGLNRIRRFFPFSPAKEGPFSGSGWTFNSGKSITEALAQGMEAREGTVVAAAEQIARAAAFDPATVPGMTVGARGGQHQADSGGPAHNVTFNITNPVAEPTSETARKASAYIGVSV
jgi:tape measure domain-containing protein